MKENVARLERIAQLAAPTRIEPGARNRSRNRHSSSPSARALRRTGRTRDRIEKSWARAPKMTIGSARPERVAGEC
jgi:hypothetical protein